MNYVDQAVSLWNPFLCWCHGTNVIVVYRLRLMNKKGARLCLCLSITLDYYTEKQREHSVFLPIQFIFCLPRYLPSLHYARISAHFPGRYQTR